MKPLLGKYKLSVKRSRDNKGIRSLKTKRSYQTIFIYEELTNQLIVYRIWFKELKLSFCYHLKEDDFIFISHKTEI